MRWWYRGWQYVDQVLFAAFFQVRVFGRENVPLQGPVLLVSNHQSYLDPILCGVGLSRELDYVARESLFRNRGFSWFIRSFNAFPIHRTQVDVTAVRTIVERLREGRSLVLFPEATRTVDGRIRPIKGGFELIARRAGVTTVPVVIDGAFEVWPRHQRVISMGQIKVMYGPGVTAQEINNMSRGGLVELINHRLRRMQAEIRRRYHKKPYNYIDGARGIIELEKK